VTDHGPLLTPERQEIVRLELAWPGWQIWIVYRVYGGNLWCARRHDGTGDVLNADSSAELSRMLQRAPS